MKKSLIFILVLSIAFITPATSADTLSVAPRDGATEVSIGKDVALLSGDTTITVPVPDEFPSQEGPVAWISWALRNWDSLLGLLTAIIVLLEVLVSVIPTKKDYSIFLKIRQLLDSIKFVSLFTRNRAAGGGTFKATSVKQP